MSFGAFYAGLSGLQSNSNRLSVIGNNLANLNTIGFKTARVTFEDIFSQPGGGAGVNGAGNPQQVGLGVQIAGIQNIFSQGSMQTTGLVTDMAIQGNGFFVMEDASGALRYSRAGAFTFNDEGFLVNTAGHSIQGYTTLDASGNVVASGNIESIQIPSGLTAPPQATTFITSLMNLDSSAAIDIVGTTIDEADVFPTSITVYDSLGERHVLSITFRPEDTTGGWSFEVTVPGDEVAGGTPGTPFVVTSGNLTFDSDGQLIAPTGNITVSVPTWTNGASAQDIEWRLFDDNGDGLLTRRSGPSSTSSTNQDGFAAGELRALTVDQDGLISGVFTNGVTLELARVALATFNNMNGMLKTGQNTFVETNSSGPATIGGANAGGRGIVRSNSLELSNVDITQEFTDLIISERGYQANSRIISTTDSVIQEALNLKR